MWVPMTDLPMAMTHARRLRTGQSREVPRGERIAQATGRFYALG
jgi:hypothetical protein